MTKNVLKNLEEMATKYPKKVAFVDKTRKITEAGNSRLIAEFRLFWFLTRYTDLGIIQKL